MALQAVVSVKPLAGVLSPGKGLAVLAGYAAFCLGAAARLVASRDA